MHTIIRPIFLPHRQVILKQVKSKLTVQIRVIYSSIYLQVVSRSFFLNKIIHFIISNWVWSFWSVHSGFLTCTLLGLSILSPKSQNCSSFALPHIFFTLLWNKKGLCNFWHYKYHKHITKKTTIKKKFVRKRKERCIRSDRFTWLWVILAAVGVWQWCSYTLGGLFLLCMFWTPRGNPKMSSNFILGFFFLHKKNVFDIFFASEFELIHVSICIKFTVKKQDVFLIII